MSQLLGGRRAEPDQRSDGSRALSVVAQPFSGPAEDDGSISLREALKIIRRRRATILVSAALMSAIGIGVVLNFVPQYTAEAVVLIGNHRASIIDPQAAVPAAQPDPVTIQNQVNILQSPTTAERVARTLDLRNYPEFNPALRPPHWYSRERLIALLPDWLGLRLMPSDAKRELTTAEIEAKTLDDVMQSLEAKTKISNDGRSDVIRIETESQDPKLATAIANAYVNAYLVDELEAKYDETKRVTSWLDERLSDLRDKVRDSENAVQVYKDSHKLDEIKGTTFVAQQITELTTQLAAASGDRAQKEANLSQVQKMLHSQGGADAASQVLTSPTIQNLKTQEGEVRRRQAELSNTYGPHYPVMVGLANQINDIHRKIQEEVGKIVQSIEADVASSRTREQALRLRLQELQNVSASQGNAQVQLRQLEREATANQTLFQNFLARFKLSSAEQNLQQADARLVASAREPREPSFPRPGVMIPIVIVVSLVIGMTIALSQELLDNGFRSAEQIEQQLGLPLLGMLPDLGRTHRPADVILSRPNSAYAEALRALSTSLRYSAGGTAPRILVITSSVPQEGKTQIATSLARSIAASGSKVLLIECDFRRPGIQKILKAPERASLTHLFEGKAGLSEVVAKDPSSGLDFIAAATAVTRPQDIFESQQMTKFLASMASQYDLVVIDTPPIMAVSDAVGLSNLADMTLFVVQWEKTPRSVALNAVKALRSNGALIAGAVLSRTNMRKHARFSFGDYGYYLSRYGNYYERRSIARKA